MTFPKKICRSAVLLIKTTGPMEKKCFIFFLYLVKTSLIKIKIINNIVESCVDQNVWSGGDISARAACNFMGWEMQY